MRQAEKCLLEQLPDCAARRYLLAMTQSIPNNANADAFVGWVCERYHTPKRGGGQRHLDSVHREAQGPVDLLRHLGKRGLDTIQPSDFRDCFRAIRQGPHRTATRNPRGKAGDRTMNEYQADAKRFLAAKLGHERAARVAEFLPHYSSADDAVSKTLTWRQVAEIRGRLQAMNLAFFILSVATPLDPTEIRTLPIDALHFEGRLGYIRVPPSPGFPNGRTVQLLFGEEVLLPYQARVQLNNPSQTVFFPRRRKPDEPLTAADIKVRVKTWGAWLGRKDLTAEDLRLTNICYLLAADFGEDYVMHGMGVRSSQRVDQIKRDVDAAKLRGHDFGQPLPAKPRRHAGFRPCVSCGFQANPDTPGQRFCGECGSELDYDHPSEAVHLLADLAGLLGRIDRLTGNTRESRAEDALNLLKGGSP